MFGISSQLASQTINKNIVWDCLLRLGRVEGDLTHDIASRMTVEGWAVGVRVVIKRSGDSKGLSTIISPFNVAFMMMMSVERKSHGLTVQRYSDRLFLVDSAQDPTNKYVVSAQPHGLDCNCMKFRCLNNRMAKEAPQFLQALGEITTNDDELLCKTGYYDPRARSLQTKVHLQCHHIRAVMREAFNAFTSIEYVLNWKRVIKTNPTHRPDPNLELFPPGNWGAFQRKAK